MTRPDPAYDLPVDCRSTTIDRLSGSGHQWSGGGQRWNRFLALTKRSNCTQQEDEDEPTWIEILEDFIINAAESPIKQIMNETFPDFTHMKSDDAYLKERTILTPRNDDVDAINTYMFEFLNTLNFPDNATSCTQPKEGSSNYALTECKPKPGSVQRDTADHHRPRPVCDSGPNTYWIKCRTDRINFADYTHIITNIMRRLVAELEAIGEVEGATKSLEHISVIVDRDPVTLGELETLLAHAQVGVSLKAGFVADMEVKD
nr:hypothetical protein [Tanacetum cinerariifolium]